MCFQNLLNKRQIVSEGVLVLNLVCYVSAPLDCDINEGFVVLNWT